MHPAKQETPIQEKDFMDHYADSSTNSLEAWKKELESVKEYDRRATKAEAELTRVVQVMCQLEATTDSMSNISGPSQKPESKQDKYEAERTSLLTGDVRYEKYPETTDFLPPGKPRTDLVMEEIDEALAQDEDLKKFNNYGIHKRPKEEILAAKIHLQQDETQAIMQTNRQLFSQIDEMNAVLNETGDKIYEAQNSKPKEEPKRYPAMQIVNLQKDKNTLISDYAEKAKDVSDNAEDKKEKKKKQKKKRKKKTQPEEQESSGLPESIKDAQRIAEEQKRREKQHREELRQQTSTWQQQVNFTIGLERKGDESSSQLSKRDNEDEVDKFFDDDFVRTDDIQLSFKDDEPKASPLVKIDLEKCKKSAAAVQSSCSQLEKLRDLHSSTFGLEDNRLPFSKESVSKFMATGINSSADLVKQHNIDLTKQVVKNSVDEQKKHKKALLHELFQPSDPVQIEKEIPTIDTDLAEPTLQETELQLEQAQEAQPLSKKKQQKAEKKKEAKEKKKLNA